MRALVVYESMWGNTEQVARAIADGIRETCTVDVVDVAQAPAEPGDDVSLVVAGGPTHAFSMSKSATRAEAHHRGADHGSDAVGIREWLDDLPAGRHPQAVATFDTKVDRMKHLPGSAAKKAEKVAARHGFDRADHAHSFFVADTDGPLVAGELERATAWGRELATTARRAPAR
jgi:hypothetical protein